MTSDAVADLKDVRLERRGRALLRGIDWNIRRGEHWAFLGAHGSGKTLTLKIMTGYLWPTSGTVSVFSPTYSERPRWTGARQSSWSPTTWRRSCPSSPTATW